MASPVLTTHTALPQLRQVVVGVAELKVCATPDHVIVTYALGSCLGITAYDPVRRVGGMLHALLPEAATCTRPDAPGAMFVDSGMQLLADEMLAQGAALDHCVVKVFGGASVMGDSGFMDIGGRNIAQMRRLMLLNRWTIAAWEVGGRVNRTIQLYLDNGDVVVRMPNQPDRCL